MAYNRISHQQSAYKFLGYEYTRKCCIQTDYCQSCHSRSLSVSAEIGEDFFKISAVVVESVWLNWKIQSSPPLGDLKISCFHEFEMDHISRAGGRKKRRMAYNSISPVQPTYKFQGYEYMSKSCIQSSHIAETGRIPSKFSGGVESVRPNRKIRSSPIHELMNQVSRNWGWVDGQVIMIW